MKKFGLLALTMGFVFVSCSSDIDSNRGDDSSNITSKIAKSITANLDGAAITISSSSSDESTTALSRASEYSQTEAAYYFVRVDSKIPTSEQEEQGLAPNTYQYYPQTSTGKSYFECKAMYGYVYPEMLGDSEYLLDAYGRATAKTFADAEPSMDDVREGFADAQVTYHDTVVYDKKNGIDLLDNYKVIWYVVKRVDANGNNAYDGVIHVDGALVPKDAETAPLTPDENSKKDTEVDKTEESKKEIEEEKEASNIDIEIPIDVTYDMVLEADDFDIRKSGIEGYVAYEKTVDANTLEYNGVTITRGSDMKLSISGLDNLDWSEEGTIWTFEAFLWAKFELIPSTWAMGDDDDVEIIPNSKYLIERHYYKGFQSNGTVPYIKVSVHVSKKEATEE